MRTKLFFSFIAVIMIALVSNLIFERFIVKDFEDYVRSSEEDKLYWVLASVEGSYSGSGWNERGLHDAVHWAIMLGLDVKISDGSGRVLANSRDVMSMLSSSMRRRMQGIVDLESAKGEYESYPLYVEGEEIGTMYARPFKRIGSISEKEELFKSRGKNFLIISFLIAGGGAIMVAIFFSLFLSRPLNRMKKAVESLAKGDFSVRVPAGSKKDELGRLARSFNFMAEAMQREEALRKHLTSNVAHELRTPLTIMKANVEAVIDGVVEDRDQGLENIRIEVEKLIRLVEGIEDITKAEASFFSRKEYEEIDLPRFLSRVVARLTPLALEKGLAMRLSSDRDVKVLSDPDKLERIAENILTNAIKNTGSGEIVVNYGTGRDMFYIEVRDTGSGIPEDKTRLVFRRFYRGEESGGIGLGLAIVKELVEVMGGQIDLKSKVGEGTVFTVWLPLQKKAGP